MAERPQGPAADNSTRHYHLPPLTARRRRGPLSATAAQPRLLLADELFYLIYFRTSLRLL